MDEQVLNLDSNLFNSDWIKTRTWDLHRIKTYEDLERHFGREGITKFLKLPAAMAMPKELAEELRKRGYDVPQKPSS